MEYKKISELTSVVTGGTPSTAVLEYWNNGTIPWLQSGCCQNCDVDSTDKYITQEGYDHSSTQMMPKGTVMIALTGATAGKVGYLSFEACGNQSITGILPCELINQRFLYYYLISQRDKILSDCVGGAQLHISQGYVKNIKVPIYEIKKQNEIVNVLTKVSSLLIYNKQQMIYLDELIKSRFDEICKSFSAKNCLSDFISMFSAKRCGDRELPILSITKANGIVFQDEKFKKRIASKDASSYKVIPRGKLVQGIHIDERNFAIQNIVDEGIVSPAYKVWTVNEFAVPEVLAYALRTDYAMDYISSKFTGSVKRRESITNDDFLAMPINLPSYNGQEIFFEFMKRVDKSKFVIYIKKLYEYVSKKMCFM